MATLARDVKILKEKSTVDSIGELADYLIPENNDVSMGTVQDIEECFLNRSLDSFDKDTTSIDLGLFPLEDRMPSISRLRQRTEDITFATNTSSNLYLTSTSSVLNPPTGTILTITVSFTNVLTTCILDVQKQ